jgi:hypothetical protein
MGLTTDSTSRQTTIAVDNGTYYIAGKHAKMTEEALEEFNAEHDFFTLNESASDFLKEVQGLADSRFKHGDKSNGRLYLHYITPKHGYDTEDHEQVLSELGIADQETASIDDFIQACENRAFAAINSLVLSRSGEITNDDAGQILYLLGTLLHVYQDEKHRQGNIFHDESQVLTSPEHFTSEIHQSFTDLFPTKKRKATAVDTSLQFFMRFDQSMRAGCNEFTNEFYERLGSFAPSAYTDAYNYRPAYSEDNPYLDMDTIFPVYEECEKKDECPDWR